MKLEYKVNYKLPPLAWLARVHDGIAEIICGKQVEIHETFFVEGAWGGDFINADFDSAEWFCGTGGILKEDSIVFAAPTGMHAGLYMLPMEKKVVVSNSLPFLMACEGYEFDSKWIGYESFFNFNILQGIYQYNPNVHTLRVEDGKRNSNESIQMILFRNISVTDQGSTSVTLKSETKGFDSFEEYYSRLSKTMKSLTANAQDNARKIKYEVTSFISSGYDAAACAAVAKEAGAKKVMTFSAKGKYAEDSGVGAAKYLGYEIIVERDADAYKSRNDFPETRSMAGGDIGTQISFCSFESDCKNHLVYSGENGDFVWGKNKSFQTINDDIHIVWKNSEIGLWESHIHQGYVPVPMTSFGIRHWSDLYRISNSKEMEQWSIGTDYDRPIPRRILEEKGVPRETFGMRKRGAGFFYAYDWKKRILSRMSAESAADFADYLHKHKNAVPISACVKYIFANKGIYWNTLMAKRHIRLFVKQPLDKIEKRNAISNPFAARYLIPWAGQHVIEEYKQALEGGS